MTTNPTNSCLFQFERESRGCESESKPSLPSANKRHHKCLETKLKCLNIPIKTRADDEQISTDGE